MNELAEQVAALAERLDRVSDSTLLVLISICALALVCLALIVNWRGIGDLSRRVGVFDDRTDRRLNDIGAREMIQTQNLASVALSLQNVVTATGELVKMQEASHTRIREADTIYAVRHGEIMAALSTVGANTDEQSVRRWMTDVLGSAIAGERVALVKEFRELRDTVVGITTEGTKSRGQMAQSLFILLSKGVRDETLYEDPVSDSDGADSPADAAWSGAGAGHPAGGAD